MGMRNDGLSCWGAESEGFQLLNTTIGDLLDERAASHPEQEAIVYAAYPEFGAALNLRWTYREYCERANAVAKGLMALGLQKGEHIAIWAVNFPEWMLLEMAAAKVGLVLATVNPTYRASELEYVLRQGDIAALFFQAKVRDHDCVATVGERAKPAEGTGAIHSETLPKLRYAFLIGPPAPADAAWQPAPFRELIALGAGISDEALKARQTQVKPSDPAQLQYTSGTTGFPKGALLTHHSILNNGAVVAHRLGTGPETRFCTAMPLFHTGGCVLGVLSALYGACTLMPLLAFDPVKALDTLANERCSRFGGVPTMLISMLQHPHSKEVDLSHLKQVFSGGSPVPVVVMEQVKAQWGADVGIVFGQTEASPTITQTLNNDSFELKSATVGKPLPHTDVKIINPQTGEIVPCGERGELCCRGYLVMAGYYNMPEKTADAIDQDDWLHTGDLATMSADGYVNIVGRLKDMVIRGGENLFPTEIEEFLMRHPKVADAQVLGVPDQFFGEELLAVVMPRAGEDITEEELRAFCTGQISHQKIPRYFKFVAAYPMTASGKVQKFVLREQAIQELGLEAVAKTRTA
ncbi:MAG TPA: AMP-binding protein [Ktedonobacterales bacterium]|nr:AMP-binding protein [Ktedonobacterales bacterium]